MITASSSNTGSLLDTFQSSGGYSPPTGTDDKETEVYCSVDCLEDTCLYAALKTVLISPKQLGVVEQLLRTELLLQTDASSSSSSSSSSTVRPE